MTTYTDYIGSGTLITATTPDYANVAIWYAASGDGDVTYDDGDEVRAIFQTSVDGHTGPHPFGVTQITDGLSWTEDKDITITFSSTNPTGSGTPDGWLELATHAHIQNASSNKVWNFKGLDFLLNTYGAIRVNYDVSSAATASSTIVNFDRCKLIAPASDSNGSIFNVGANTAGQTVSGINQLNFNNCLVIPKVRIVNAQGGENNTNTIICKLAGCTLQSSGTGNSNWFYHSTKATASFEVHMSGCIADYFEVPSQWDGVVYNPGIAGYTSGTAVDYITNEPASIVNAWADSRTNVSSAATFVYGVAPGANQVSFSGVTLENNPFDFYTRDLRLWESTNNIASGFVSNVTLPSPDLAGHSRGSTPFDAGPFEISFISGGGGGSDTTISLVLVSVNLYN